ncbi:epimerase [Novosphingobium sp. PC22D]|uniref:NAD-dependent epimerase/dehydratase family protein n=1 Tax=Novosphingobium sp. PC22D TaxID=1962403 RepID=UPI000BFB00BD|nr:NAD-dependent epimerase/dehydratase family protein [Novosphingobium sp. PC22D]PEQ12635.1 epimerase [Novosphingobium sp. PC22D]
MTIAITGATGFVGAALLDRTLAAGTGVRALTRRPQAQREGVSWIAGDLADRQALADLVRGAGAVIHVAGVVSAPDRDGFERGNVAGTRAVVEAARAQGVRRFVHVSSLSAREPQLSLYGASKARAEVAVAASGLDWTTIRPPAIYGPRDKDMLDLFRAARRGVVPVPADGRASMIHVDDLARLLLALAERSDGETLGACHEPDDGVPGGWSHRELAHAIGEAVGRRVRVIGLPPRVMNLAARIDEALRGPKAKLTRDRAAYLAHPDWVCDPAAAVPRAIWRPTIETRAGLAATAAWYRGQGWL